jgi:hypothetical protein
LTQERREHLVSLSSCGRLQVSEHGVSDRAEHRRIPRSGKRDGLPALIDLQDSRYHHNVLLDKKPRPSPLTGASIWYQMLAWAL